MYPTNLQLLAGAVMDSAPALTVPLEKRKLYNEQAGNNRKDLPTQWFPEKLVPACTMVKWKKGMFNNIRVYT